MNKEYKIIARKMLPYTPKKKKKKKHQVGNDIKTWIWGDFQQISTLI